MSVPPTNPTPYNNWREFVEQVVIPLHGDEDLSSEEMWKAQEMWNRADDHYKKACLFLAYHAVVRLEDEAS